MINGFDINPLATKMHLHELEREIARTRGRTAARRIRTTPGPVERLSQRIADWLGQRGGAHRPDPAASFLPT